MTASELRANIRIILVRPFHPGNIGSSARSLKTMGLSQLALVAPKQFPHTDAIKMAAGAKDLIEQAQVYDSLEQAVADCTAIVATSARSRGFDLPTLSPEACAKHLLEHASQSKVALVFGPERMGLHNEDLKLAKHRVSIPANSEYCSLNLAAAVQLLAYEIFKATSELPAPTPTEPLPNGEQMSRFYQHLEEVLRQIAFLRPHEGETLSRLHELFARACASEADIRILRGILTSIQKTLAGERRPNS